MKRPQIPVKRGPILPVYVPAADTHLSVLPRSAIVGAEPDWHGRVLTYFEGNAYAIPDLALYTTRLRHAADRAMVAYPTVAMAAFASDELVEVARYDTRTHRLTALLQPTALAAYLGPEPLPVLWSDEQRRDRLLEFLTPLGVAASMAGPALTCASRWTGKFEVRGGRLYAECVAASNPDDAPQWLDVCRTSPLSVHLMKACVLALRELEAAG